MSDPFEKRPFAALAAAAVLLALVAAADVYTGLEFGMAPLYLFPAILAAWYCGRGPGLLLSAAGAFAISWAERAGGRVYLHGAAPYWNGFAAFCSLAITAELVVRLKWALGHEREAARLKSSMLSLASHEFSNSLTILGGAVETLENETDPAKRRELCDMLSRVHATLKQTTENFLNEARLESGRYQLRLRPTDVMKPLTDYWPVAQSLAAQKDVALRLEAPQRCVALADGEALVLVVSNLVGNAIKYTPSRGRVDVKVLPGHGAVDFEVADTGIGIARENLAKLARSQYRTPRGKSMAKGFGLGLMIARKILEAHGTRLEIDSEPGRGSQFRFRLPLADGGH